MREIVGFQLGNCGNSLGSNFWNCLSYEHGLDEDGVFRGESDLQLERINVYYEEGLRGGRYVPRAIGIDLEGSRLESVLSERDGRMFRPDSFVGGKEGGSNNYARGYFSDGHELINRIMDVSRRETERCDSPQGYQILHGVGGGTGAGLTGLLIEGLKDEFMEKMVLSFSVLPSPKVSDIVVEPYNAVLGIKHLVQDTELSFCLDNEALISSCTRGLGLAAPRFADLNFLISNAISGITTCLRFPGQLNTGLMKLAVNAVPFPRLHFMIPSFVPLMPRMPPKSKTPLQMPIRVADMIRELLHPRCRMVAADLRRGKYLTATSIFRGRMSTKEVETSLKLIKDRNSNHFVQWIPDNVKIAICDIPPRGVKRAATFFANNTAIAAVWVRILEQYRVMYRRRAYLHWYLGEGMEEQDFDEAETTLLDLIDEYIPYSSNAFPLDDDADDHGAEMDAHDAPFYARNGRGGKKKTAPSPPKNLFADGAGGDGIVGRGMGGRRREEEFGLVASNLESPRREPLRDAQLSVIPEVERGEDWRANEVDASTANVPEVWAPDAEREADEDSPEAEPELVDANPFERTERISTSKLDHVEASGNVADDEGEREKKMAHDGVEDGDVDEDVEEDVDSISRFLNDVRTKKRKTSQNSHEFDRIMDKKDST